MDNLLIFVPVSRENRIKEVINDINNLEIGDFNVEVLLLIDDIRIPRLETKYKTKLLYTGNYSMSEWDIYKRRIRIAENFNKASDWIKGQNRFDLMFIFEDDCEIKPETFIKLNERYSGYDFILQKLGFVSGVQAGRWGEKMLGVWNIDGDKIKTLKLTKDINLVTACGFYGFVIRPELFCLNKFRSGFFGPDVYFGIDLDLEGYSNYCDMTVKIGHKLNDGGVLYPTGEEKELTFKINE